MEHPDRTNIDYTCAAAIICEVQLSHRLPALCFTKPGTSVLFIYEKLRGGGGMWGRPVVLYWCGCFAVDTGLSWVTPALVLLGLGLWRKRTVQVCSYLERHFQA